MTRKLAIIAAAAAVASILATAESGNAGGTGCKPGVATLDGSPARVFCGPARASVRVAGKTLSFTNGLCEQGGGGFVVNIGTFFPSSDTSKRPYFGLFVTTPRPGSYTRQQLSFRAGGVGRAAFVTVKLKSLRAGTFAGAVVGGGRVTGSFTC
jgi:hypothetical protein